MEQSERGGSGGGMPSPDVTTNYSQANMLKMLKTAKDMVSSARVENSLDNATKTLESWSRRGADNVRAALPPPRVAVGGEAAGHAGRLPYISSMVDNHSPYPRRALTPTYAPPPLPQQQPHYGASAQTLLDKPRVVARPTPLRYTLPARGSQHGLERTLPISSLSSPHIAMRDPVASSSCDLRHAGKLYVESQSRHPMSPFVPYREFQAPDVYLYPKGPLRRKFSYPPDCLSRRRRSQDHRMRGDYDEPRSSCLAELRANNLLSNHSPAAGCAAAGHYPASGGGGCASCVRSYLEPETDDVPLLGKDKLNRRASFLKATWANERVHQLDETEPSTSQGARADVPDLFPRVVVANAKPHKLYGSLGHNLSCYPLAAEPAYLDPAHMGSYPYKQKLKYSDPTRLPSYREAILQNAAALRRSSSTVVHRHYSTYLNSYTDLPVYVGPSQWYGGSKDQVCHLFPCASHCPEGGAAAAAVLPRVADRPLAYHNSVFGPYDGPAASRDEPPGSGSRERRQVLVARRVNSPYVPKPWGRVSSLESEV